MHRTKEVSNLYRISGIENGNRIESRILEERIQNAVYEGRREMEIEAFGQHGIGGRLWRAGDEEVYVRVIGSSGQRLGSMGFPNTCIEVMGPVSDDVGWLNAGAEIIVHGNATNGAGNAMAQGKIYISGNIGARGMTMTKHNPRFDPPELWVLGSVGDYFAEFMAGGIAIICGIEAQNPQNILGYRPCVGMVGGKIFFRGHHEGYSKHDAKLVEISQEDWDWLRKNTEIFLGSIGRSELIDELTNLEEWQLLIAKTPYERSLRTWLPMKSFHKEVWDRELGQGGLIGDLTDIDRSPIPIITTGELRRLVPVWENKKYAPPCQASCPSGIPVHERWRLVREGKIDEAVDLALSYTPFPATVCGYLCPNLCMQACTRNTARMAPVDVTKLGQASLEAHLPELPPLSGRKIAVIGGGPAGISVAWQLRRKGHETVVYDNQEELGGKIVSVIPRTRIPEEIVMTELKRIREVIPHVHLRQELKKEDVEKLKKEYEYVVIAVGAKKPRILPVPGKERLIPALDFLRKSRKDAIEVGKRVVVIGAGNVGCDAATEAHRLGADEVTLIDIQEPLSFGKEREAAEKIGAKFKWPCFTKAITDKGVELSTGEIVPADTVIISIGDQPDLEFLPDNVAIDRGFIVVNDMYQTTDPQIFAIGDAVRLGLLTEAIGAGRIAAEAISDIFEGKRPHLDKKTMLDPYRVKLEYYDPRLTSFHDVHECGTQCASCGACRDCGLCVTICPESAISRKDRGNGDFEMVVDPDRCIGCGFCAGACPCGIWNLVENDPIE